MRTLRGSEDTPVGIDIKPSAYTDIVGSVADRGVVSEAVNGCDAIIHTATLHKPHVGTHTRQDFVDTNITGTLNLLEEANAQGCGSLIYTSTTSTFGDAMKPVAGEPSVWVTEQLQPKPKNIYGTTKTAAEDLCALFHRNTELSCIVLKTSRFFPEEDDSKQRRESFADMNLKVNELLFRRVDVADIVTAHQLALLRAPAIGFDRFIISATSPFRREDATFLSSNAPAVVEQYLPEYVPEYQRREWQMFQALDRVYDSTHATEVLGWKPVYTFAHAIEQLRQDKDYRSKLSIAVGSKGYHDNVFEDGPYPVRSF